MPQAKSEAWVSHIRMGVTMWRYTISTWCGALRCDCVTAHQLVLVAQVREAQSCFI